METGKIERNPDAPEAWPLTRSGRDLDREAADRLDEIRQYFTPERGRSHDDAVRSGTRLDSR